MTKNKDNIEKKRTRKREPKPIDTTETQTATPDNINNEINKEYIAEFFGMVEKGVRKHGVQKIASVLKNLDAQSDFYNRRIDVIVKHICTCVVDEYKSDKIKSSDLFNRSKRGEITAARKMAIILLKEHLDISDNKIANFFGRTRQIVFYTIQEFKDLKPSNKFDAMFLNRHYAISRKITKFIQDNFPNEIKTN